MPLHIEHYLCLEKTQKCKAQYRLYVIIYFGNKVYTIISEGYFVMIKRKLTDELGEETPIPEMSLVL